MEGIFKCNQRSHARDPCRTPKDSHSGRTSPGRREPSLHDEMPRMRLDNHGVQGHRSKEKKAVRQKQMEILSSSAVTKEEKAPESTMWIQQKNERANVKPDQRGFRQHAEQRELVREHEQSF